MEHQSVYNRKLGDIYKNLSEERLAELLAIADERNAGNQKPDEADLPKQAVQAE